MQGFLLYLGFTVLLLTIGDTPYIWVDDFESGHLEEWNGRNKRFEEIYSIKKEESNNYLLAQSLNSDNFMIKKFEVDIVQYPYLNWKWKAIELPHNGDESCKKTCDVAASVNVILRASKWRPRTIKYSWSTTLTPDSCFVSPFSMWPSRADVRVIRSGADQLIKWTVEKVNVLEDYKRFYKKKKVKSFTIEAIVIMTDSDNTGSPSIASYDDIYFSKE